MDDVDKEAELRRYISELEERIVELEGAVVGGRQTERERELLMAAIEQGAEAVFITDIEGAIQYANSTFERMTGYTRKEVFGRNPRMLKSGEQDDAFYKEMWDTLLGGKVWTGRIVNKKKDGALFTEEATISPVRDATGQTVNYVAVKRDVSEEIKIEEQLRHAQKMESIGRLAGGVAHDFNNMLLVILGHTEMAMDAVDKSLPLHASLTEIRKAAKRSADLTRQLLAFARKQTIDPRVLDLNATVEGMLKMLRRVIGENVELSWRPGPGVWPVKMDPSQIDQILANLCVNARDAIDGVGRVTIETENVCFDEAFCAERKGFAPGEYVSLAVSDTGRGMEKETLERLFEPYFTTKEMGKGTGLGLSTVYGLVEQNHGFLIVCSEPGRGTTFKIYLARDAGEVPELQSTGPDDALEMGDETILVVEDEPGILKIVSSMLQRLGYCVLAASSPREAIRLAEANSGEIDLLITDVIMPEMNGRALATELVSFFPKIKQLFMSGYTANVIAHHGVLDEDQIFIQKPFAMRDLAAKVREALDSG